MKKFKYNKLVRDKVVDMSKQEGSHITWHQLDDHDYDQQLRLKLIEETTEIHQAQSDAELLSEIADVYEVLEALCVLHNLSRTAIKSIQEERCHDRGGFSERIFITDAQHPAGSRLETYCLAAPDKYPEIITE